MADGDCSVRKFRGQASLKFLDTLQPGHSLLNSPVGRQNTDYLSMYITHLARDGNKFPLTVKHWRNMPFKFILNAMAEIKRVFDYPDELDDWIKAKLHNRWKDHKHFANKEGFSQYTTLEERLAHRPNDVVESQWGELVEFWQNPKHQERCAGCKANRSKGTAQQSTGAGPHEKNAAQLAAKLKRAPTAKETYDATHKKRKKQMEGLESKPSQHNSISSSKKMKMSAEASGSRGKKAVPKNKPVRRSERLNKPEHLPLTRSNSIPASPVPLIQECVTEDGEDNMQAVSNESIEGFGTSSASSGEPIEAVKATSSIEPVEAARTTYSAEPVKTTSSVELVDGARLTSSASFAEPVEAARLTASSSSAEHVQAARLTSISSPKDTSTRVSGGESDEELEFVDNFRIPKGYTVLCKKTIKVESDESLEGFGSVGEPVEAARLTSSAFSAEPIEAVKTTTSTSVSRRESDEELEFVDSFQIPKEYTVLCKKTIKAESDESLEDFGFVVGKPVEPARMTSSALSTELVEAAKTTSSAEPVEAAKTTSSVECPTVDSKLASTSSAKDISAPFVRSTSVSVRGSDEEFEFVDNFKIPKEYAVLYKKIFEKYGHMATKKVIKSNDAILVAFVSTLLEMISTMETMRGADLSDSLLQTWEGDIEDVENLGFNVKWLREKFDEVKKNWKFSSGIHKEVEIHEKELDATQVKYVSLLARKGKLYQEISEVIIEIREAEKKISSEKKSIQEMLAPENNFLDEPILGKLLS